MENQYSLFLSPWCENLCVAFKGLPHAFFKKALDHRKFNHINLHITNLKTRNHIINCETM